MSINGLAKARFVRAATASALALSLGACATRMVNENGMVTEGLDLGIIRTTNTTYDPRVTDATDINRLRTSTDPRLARIGEVATCVVQESAPPVTAQRVTEADRIDSALARAEGNANSGICPPGQVQQQRNPARRAAAPGGMQP